ncbi:hypothetical protein [Phyllobacterium myrsinacearum]|uniref:N-acetyltransferase domain-containing protein n=1 Tax=Phyllobacterium myrsinacearum TaxID=28101 RepID=A0A839ES80_9HYPH|nr:hypothetical protein [Phyllobacterium myrsinacearum]MBA8881662.1 hypothetical protein [Phyllobacterium myrsinacearum]
MRQIARYMFDALDAEAFRGVRGIQDGAWHVNWSVRSYRINDKVEDNVLVIHAIEIAEQYRRQGYLTEVFQAIIDQGEIGQQKFNFILFENCGEHLLECLRTKLMFSITDPTWRRLAHREIAPFLPFANRDIEAQQKRSGSQARIPSETLMDRVSDEPRES